MKTQELREQTVEQLSEKLAELKVELFNLRFQHVINQLGNPMRIRAVKKDIARIKTIVTQKENQKGEKEV
ncbi:MAG: 50S ribosomal protein L29 [Oscillospiraceae bacterium]|jgi:large subunit ribosomal protein L29|nr:50S ribosomal protein L29 [Oscillospiraceae bacterium]